jgi:hypothetical protein
MPVILFVYVHRSNGASRMNGVTGEALDLPAPLGAAAAPSVSGQRPVVTSVSSSSEVVALLRELVSQGARTLSVLTDGELDRFSINLPHPGPRPTALSGLACAGLVALPDDHRVSRLLRAMQVAKQVQDIITLPDGVPWLDIDSSTLYVRRHYAYLYNDVLKHFRGAAVLGTPGSKIVRNVDQHPISTLMPPRLSPCGCSWQVVICAVRHVQCAA